VSYLVNQQSQQGKEPLEFTDIMESTNDDIPKISSITQVNSFFDEPSLDWACLTPLFYQKNLYGMENQIAKLTAITTEMICTMCFNHLVLSTFQ
jgi:hypothetical protein